MFFYFKDIVIAIKLQILNTNFGKINIKNASNITINNNYTISSNISDSINYRNKINTNTIIINFFHIIDESPP